MVAYAMPLLPFSPSITPVRKLGRERGVNLSWWGSFLGCECIVGMFSVPVNTLTAVPHCFILTDVNSLLKLLWQKKNLSKIPKMLTVTHGLVTPRLNYGNVFLKSNLGASAGTVWWTVWCTPRTAHVTSLLGRLRWLTVSFQVQFRVLILTFKALHCMGPGWGTLLTCYMSAATWALADRVCCRFHSWVTEEMPSLVWSPPYPSPWN